MSADSIQWMERAIEQARQGVGLTRPNPPVGAVVVKNGRAIGQGYHRKAGGPHAEIYALREAGARVRGSELYITLEPCSTQGRTPPCTDAIIQAGVHKVIYACEDPNPRHAGQANNVLQQAGIEVVHGIHCDAAAELIEPFRLHQTMARPRVVLKMGMTLDGRIADRRGASKWITGPASRGRVQDLRRMSDGILVGAETVRLDDPSLLPRPAKGRKPYRIVVDSRARVPLASRILNDGYTGQTIVAATTAAAASRQKALERKGAHVWALPSRKGRVSLKALMKALGREGLLQVLCEGGGRLAGEMVRQRLVDEFQFFVAPKLLGGQGTRPVLEGFSVWLDQAFSLSITHVDVVGDDVRIVAVPRK